MPEAFYASRSIGQCRDKYEAGVLEGRILNDRGFIRI